MHNCLSGPSLTRGLQLVTLRLPIPREFPDVSSSQACAPHCPESWSMIYPTVILTSQHRLSASSWSWALWALSRGWIPRFQPAYLQEVALALFPGACSSASFSVWSPLVLEPLTSDVGSRALPLFHCEIRRRVHSVFSPHRRTRRQPRLYHLFKGVHLFRRWIILEL